MTRVMLWLSNDYLYEEETHDEYSFSIENPEVLVDINENNWEDFIMDMDEEVQIYGTIDYSSDEDEEAWESCEVEREDRMKAIIGAKKVYEKWGAVCGEIEVITDIKDDVIEDMESI